ncbi:reverse transcriptase domain-containing protein [Tanacetum coccineum]
MKKSIAELPMLTAPKEKKEQIMYLAAAKEAISAVLMTERDRKQMPIYFVSRALQGPEINYAPMEKLILALRPEDDPQDTPIEDEESLLDPWILFTDGSSCIDGFGADLITTNPEGVEFTYALRITLVANQVNGIYIAKEPGMIKYLEKVKALTSTFKEFSIKQVPRGENKKADALIPHGGNPCRRKKRKARAIRRKAARYAVINKILYKRSFLGPWLRCVGPLQANYVLREIHEGSCSMHAGPRSVVAKALRSGYYWPTMHTDARKLIKECSSCQGIDIAEPFPEGPSKVKFLIVAIDYFTKWIEAKPVASITGAHIKKFVWDNIVCRFGLPREIISDNGKQFRDNPFKDWCENLCEGIKARLDERSKNWMEEISHVLWAHRTMIKSSNIETPFSLTYGTEAVIQVEIGMPTLRTAEVDMIKNDEALEINLDLFVGNCLFLT